MAVQTPMSKRRLSEHSSVPQHPLVPLCNFLVSAMCVTAVVAVLFWILVAYLDRHSKHPTATCTSHACREYAHHLLASLNRSVDPCHSFTHFVCDGWRKRHMFGVHERTFGAATERITRIVRTIDVPRSGQNTLERAAMLFRTCTALLSSRKGETAGVKAALRDAGVTWPHRPLPTDRRDLVRMMLHCDYALGWSAVFRVDYEEHGNETKAYVLTDSAFNFIVRKHHERGSQPRRLHYFTVLRDSFRDTDESGAAGDDNLVTFEDTLALESKMLEPLLAELLTTAPRPSTVPAEVVYNAAANLSMQRWTDALEREGVKVQQRLSFHTLHLPFFATFVDLWVLHGEQEMFAFVSWCMVQVAALFANADLIENFYGHKQRATIFHNAFCLGRAYIGAGKPLLTSYAHEVLPKSTRSRAESLTLAVRAAFHRRLSNWPDYNDSVGVFRLWDSNWMAFSIFEPTPKTKFDVIVGEMGGSFLQNWRNAWLSRTGFRNVDIKVAITAIETLAFSADVDYRKDFVLLPYAFTFPYYDADALPAINYGGFGSKVALAAAERFYSSYFSSGAGGASIGEFRLCLTNDSFGADRDDEASFAAEVVSLGSLVDAYRNTSDNRRLEILERLTGEQLLFIASCYTKCTGSYYPVSESACDAALRHVPEFAQAFSCAPGTPMNPDRRCKLF
ncbi:hypothetical protein V5799_021240 [Amblyomma americanum]|uniref:Peptidase M13 N-terminal domain-containing protein n=1 Tax=Amblyomma americanum TaxID=6943 RepID=A0AAQ4FP16_AMBAM